MARGINRATRRNARLKKHDGVHTTNTLTLESDDGDACYLEKSKSDASHYSRNGKNSCNEFYNNTDPKNQFGASENDGDWWCD